jgi:hypothetical protein
MNNHCVMCLMVGNSALLAGINDDIQVPGVVASVILHLTCWPAGAFFSCNSCNRMICCCNADDQVPLRCFPAASLTLSAFVADADIRAGMYQVPPVSAEAEASAVADAAKFAAEQAMLEFQEAAVAAADMSKDSSGWHLTTAPSAAAAAAAASTGIRSGGSSDLATVRQGVLRNGSSVAAAAAAAGGAGTQHQHQGWQGHGSGLAGQSSVEEFKT